MDSLDELYKEYGFWRVQEELVSQKLLELKKRLNLELSKPRDAKVHPMTAETPTPKKKKQEVGE